MENKTSTSKFSFNWQFAKDMILLILIIAVVYFISTCNQHAGEMAEMKRVEKLLEQSVKHYKDEAGRNHAVIQTISASSAVIEKVFAKKLDSVAKIYDTKTKNIKEYIELAFKAKGSGTGDLAKPGEIKIIHDTIDGVVKVDTLDSKFTVDDGFLTLQADIYKTGKYKYNYFYTDSLMAVKREEKYGFLRMKKRIMYDFTFTNTNSYITGLQQFERQNPLEKKRFGIGPYAGYGWNYNKFGLSFGVGVTYNLLRF